MAEQLLMPKLGFDMAEGTLINWTVQEGDTINKGDVIAEIETDKATIEIEAQVGGTVLKLLAAPGDSVAVGSAIGYVGEAGEEIPGDGAAPAVEAAAPAPEAPAAVEAAPAPAAPAAPAPAETSEFPGGVKASPIARRVAEERGIDLRRVPGTGPGGRIVKKDVEGFTAEEAPAAPVERAAPAAIPAPTVGELPTGPDVEIIDLSNLRQRIGQRMVESKQYAPHFYVTSDIDVTALLALRSQLNENAIDDAHKISVNDLIVKAAALTLRQYPNLNTHFYGDKVARYNRIHIGIAVAMPGGGLINVVARDADKTALGTMAAQNRSMIARAREGKVKPDEIEGSTFTVSNLGPYEVDQFVAIINPPEAAIIAVGSAMQVPVVLEDGSIGVGTRMKATISVDHRVSDGAEAAEYMRDFKALLENPMRLLM
ncbi:MAG: 2-oxo acid dehydrogenase subunit E2 [Anaerolineae bacterium]|nr:2-oxo acid dehydrogenase subunit E2 [Anaerolineae bacterium]